jgi:hypothetical protein
VIGRKCIIATILPSQVQQQKQECSLPSKEEEVVVESEEELQYFDAESRFAVDNEEEEDAMKKRESVR